MQVKLIHIGNSMGLRLPKSLIKQFSLDKGEIEIVIEQDGIKIKPFSHTPPLETWDLLFKQAMENDKHQEDDVFLGMKNDADDIEWEW